MTYLEQYVVFQNPSLRNRIHCGLILLDITEVENMSEPMLEKVLSVKALMDETGYINIEINSLFKAIYSFYYVCVFL